MAEKKSTKIEREYVIPLREKCRPVPRYKKTPKAIKSIKEFLVKHMQIRDRDLNKIKIDSFLNEQIWERGIKKPTHKVKVRAVKEGDIVKVYAVDLPTKLKFKQKRLEKRETKAIAQLEDQKSMMDKAKEQMKAPTKEEKLEKEIEKTGVSKETATKEAELSVEEEEKSVKKEKAKEKKKEIKIEEDKKEKDKALEKTEKKIEKTEHKEEKHTTQTKKTGEPAHRTVSK